MGLDLGMASAVSISRNFLACLFDHSPFYVSTPFKWQQYQVSDNIKINTAPSHLVGLSIKVITMKRD
jgi:hypothetical protein